MTEAQTKETKKEESKREPVIGEKGYTAPQRILNWNDFQEATKVKNSPSKAKILSEIFLHNSGFSGTKTGTPDLRLLSELALLTEGK